LDVGIDEIQCDGVVGGATGGDQQRRGDQHDGIKAQAYDQVVSWARKSGPFCQNRGARMIACAPMAFGASKRSLNPRLNPYANLAPSKLVTRLSRRISWVIDPRSATAFVQLPGALSRLRPL